MFGFGFTSDWSRKWREIFQPITSVAMQNQSNCGITFDTQLKSALSVSVVIGQSSNFDFGLR